MECPSRIGTKVSLHIRQGDGGAGLDAGHDPSVSGIQNANGFLLDKLLIDQIGAGGFHGDEDQVNGPLLQQLLQAGRTPFRQIQSDLGILLPKKQE